MIYQAENKQIRIALAGDLMPSRTLTRFTEPDYLALVQLLRGCDVAFANLETTVRENNEGAPVFTKGTPMSTSPELLDDVKWLGVNLVSCANNHATDYGVEGMLAAGRHLRQARLPAAGQGENLGAARAPVYVDTPAGRVALVAATSFFPPSARASDQRFDAGGRPGINPIAFSSSYRVDAQTFAELRRMDELLGFRADRARKKGEFYSASEIGSDSENKLNVLGSDFTLSDGFGVSTRASQADVEGCLRSLREARRQADWVIFSFHFHELGQAGALQAQRTVDLLEPAQFITEVSRAAIDAGADLVAGHGPHVTLGLELYKGKPIVYSLGNFVFQNETIGSIPSESYARFGLPAQATPADFFDTRTGNGTRGFPATAEYWQSFIAVCEFSAGALAGLVLQPIDLGFGHPRGQRGRPVLARGDTAQQILTRAQRLCARHGVTLQIDGEVGRIRLDQQ